MGRDWLPFYDSTIARFWWLSPQGREVARPRVRACLESTGAGTWLADEEQRKLGVHFEDHRFGEDLFVLHPGGLIAPSFMGKEPVRGMHGYHPDEPTSCAIALSNRPFPDAMRHVVDVADHLCTETMTESPCPASAS